ncbi:hypothetical protein BH10PLA1_BH10PLA1_04370 [soil metagenome]
MARPLWQNFGSSIDALLQSCNISRMTHYLCRTLVVLLAAMSAMRTLAAPPTTEPALISAVETAIREHLAPHPRLLLDRDASQALASRISADPRLAALLKRTRACADTILTQPPLERKLVGRRLLSVSRDALYRIATLSTAYRLTGEHQYADGAIQTMLTAAAFSDFHPEHFLDTAEMTAALAIGYDWLWAELSADQRQVIRQAIVEKGIAPSYAKPMTWTRGGNNWNQVCNGGMVLGALAVAEDEPALARRVIERAIDGLPYEMKHYAPDGAYPEGANYWGYGTTYNCLAIAALESSLGSDFGISKQPGFLTTADYHLHIVGPTARNFSYSDCDEPTSIKAAAYFLAGKRKDPSLLFNELKLLDALLAEKDVPLGADRENWLLLTWAGSLETAAPKATHYTGGGDTPVAMHRTSWEKDATFVAIKGGSPGTSHAHMDVGSFCIDALGQRWAGDLGMQNYNSLESKDVKLWDFKQNSQRWQVYRIGPMSHNILTVNGKEQVVMGKATILRSTQNFTIVDTGPVYEGQLAAARRGVLLRPDRSVRIQDEIQGASAADATVRWAVLTRANVKIGDASAELTSNGRHLTMRLVSPAGTTFKVVSTDPPHDYDAPNPNSRLVTFETAISAGESKTLVVDFVPETAGNDTPKVTPLDDW